MEAGIVARGVVKSFGSIPALANVDLTVKPGQVVALLGANGAGKSTLVRILATTLIPDAGRVEVGGWETAKEPARARSAAGVVLGEERSFFWRLTGRQNLEFFAGLHGMRRREARARTQGALESTGLVDLSDRRVDQYSSGMRSRLSLARALLGQPSVLLLDEPTRSLDPLAAIAVRKLVLNLAAERSLAVLFVTHDLHEAAALSTAVVILAQGHIATVVQDQTDAVGLERTFVAIDAARN
jgi:ABC-2 type transport system ATP-binding protein